MSDMDVTKRGKRSTSKRRREPPGGRDAGLLLSARVLMSGQRAFIGVVVPI